MDTREALVKAMNEQGISDPLIRNGIMAIAENEGGFGEMKPEASYAGTKAQRIRDIFTDRVSGLSDGEINTMKKNDKVFFNFVYSGSNRVGHVLGNRPGTDDGYNTRGRGPIQLTGLGNYTRYAKLSGHPEILDNFDLVSDPEIGAAITVAYILDRFHGGDFEDLMASVGTTVGDVVDRKRQAFNTNIAAHAYDAGADVKPAVLGHGNHDRNGTRAVQAALIAAGYDLGRAGADGIWGNDTDAAIGQFQSTNSLPVTHVADESTKALLGVV